MKQANAYVYKGKSVIAELVLAGMMVGLILFALIKMYMSPLALFFVITLPAVLLYFQMYVVLITRQFNRYDNSKRITISEDRTTLTYIHQNVTITINRGSIAKVEIYEQKDLGKFGNYTYMVIYTNTAEQILITKFTVPLLANDRIMQVFLSRVPRIYFKKQFNFIDRKKFPLP
ncbi:hypothetical protein [Mucilaginibacter flavus]|uniref:hypothetical protein n=1 Tax=Mucilaginibacter flavus TaxID=931504 RepID=UPI0025B389FB|nr:hypothetical protein [Mucilaginibacter flavus]MDN3579471.1 hypothetical protein [Mucilaginibacter flavus]